MRVLMVTSEATPLIKTGGLGDAVSSLARSLSDAGVQVTLLLPHYSAINLPPMVETGSKSHSASSEKTLNATVLQPMPSTVEKTTHHSDAAFRDVPDSTSHARAGKKDARARHESNPADASEGAAAGSGAAAAGSAAFGSAAAGSAASAGNAAHSLAKDGTASGDGQGKAHEFVAGARIKPATKIKAESAPASHLTLSWDGEEYEFLRCMLPDSNIEVLLVENEDHFGRAGVYGSPAEPDFADNPARFAYFCQAAMAVCTKDSQPPDIIHMHDWPAAPCAAMLAEAQSQGKLKGCYSVLTIHNLGYQGVYSKDFFPAFGLPWEAFHGRGFEYFDKINMLKAGIASAHFLTTVSPTYAREIQTPAMGFGLDGMLRFRASELVGILNGIDEDVWDPSKDACIPARFGRDNLAGKAECKAAAQREFGLSEDPNVPLIGMVTRLSDQKGIGDLFGPMHGSAWDICHDMNLQMVVVGTGDAWCEKEIMSLASRLPNFRARIAFDEKMAHLVEAGADFFLMPSRYEPCGLNQMYSLRYGTLPIVHRTGGLADTVENYNQETGEGTGFMFDLLTPDAIYDTVGWAIWAWYNRPEHLSKMRKKAMMQSLSWKKSSREYIKLYEHVRAERTAKRQVG